MSETLPSRITTYTYSDSKKEVFYTPGNRLKSKNKSEELYNQLSPELQDKYNSAVKHTTNILSSEGLDPEAYSIYLSDTLPNKITACFYLNSGIHESYIKLNKDYIEKESEQKLIMIILHELVGHALSSRNSTKRSSNPTQDGKILYQSGLKFSTEKYKTEEYYSDKFKKHTISLLYKYNQNLELSDIEKEVVTNLYKIYYNKKTDEVHLEDADFYEFVKSFATGEQEQFVIKSEGKIKKFGEDIDEGVTDLITIKLMSKHGFGSFDTLTSEAAYFHEVSSLIRIGEKLARNKNINTVNEWYDTLIDAKASGNYKIIIDFLKNKSAFKIKPRHLAKLYFYELSEKLDEEYVYKVMEDHDMNPADYQYLENETGDRLPNLFGSRTLLKLYKRNNDIQDQKLRSLIDEIIDNTPK